MLNYTAEDILLLLPKLKNRDNQRHECRSLRFYKIINLVLTAHSW